jgi:hypothetical protein
VTGNAARLVRAFTLCLCKAPGEEGPGGAYAPVRGERERGAGRDARLSPVRASRARSPSLLIARTSALVPRSVSARVDVNGVELEYEVTGAGEPVLLVSPGPATVPG